MTNRNARSFMLNMPNQSGVDMDVKFGKFLQDGGRPEAIELVRQLLIMDPMKRMTCSAALDHTWLTDVREPQKHEVSPGFTVVCDDIETMPGSIALEPRRCR